MAWILPDIEVRNVGKEELKTKKRKNKGVQVKQGCGKTNIPFSLILEIRAKWKAGGMTTTQLAYEYGKSDEWIRTVVYEETRRFR